MEKWRYYNHAMIPNTAPHELPDLTEIENGNIWHHERSPLLVRWTTSYDCGYETNWWYCIKDEPFNISELNSNYRYKINKGNKNFIVKRINPVEYVDELYKITIAAYKTWPDKYRPNIEEETFKNEVYKWSENNVVLAAFTRENNIFAGYTLLTEYEGYVDFNMLRVDSIYEKLQINAAIVNGILEYYSEKLSGDFYVLDGARNINHETFFQDYLEKYFHFRKAYCRLHIEYNPKIKWIIKISYYFRKALQKMDNLRIMHSLNALLKMEEIARNDNE